MPFDSVSTYIAQIVFAFFYIGALTIWLRKGTKCCRRIDSFSIFVSFINLIGMSQFVEYNDANVKKRNNKNNRNIDVKVNIDMEKLPNFNFNRNTTNRTNDGVSTNNDTDQKDNNSKNEDNKKDSKQQKQKQEQRPKSKQTLTVEEEKDCNKNKNTNETTNEMKKTKAKENNGNDTGAAGLTLKPNEVELTESGLTNLQDREPTEMNDILSPMNDLEKGNSVATPLGRGGVGHLSATSLTDKLGDLNSMLSFASSGDILGMHAFFLYILALVFFYY